MNAVKVLTGYLRCQFSGIHNVMIGDGDNTEYIYILSAVSPIVKLHPSNRLENRRYCIVDDQI